MRFTGLVLALGAVRLATAAPMDQRDVKVRVDTKASPDVTENYQRWAKREVESPDGTENYQRWAKRDVASPDATENYQRWAKREVESPDATENYQRWAKREVDHNTMEAHNMME